MLLSLLFDDCHNLLLAFLFFLTTMTTMTFESKNVIAFKDNPQVVNFSQQFRA